MKTQINARLSSTSRARFEAYADKVGLDAGELARLLIVREMHLRRALRPDTPNRMAATTKGKRKLTAHFHRSGDVAKFDRYARDRGLSRAAAAKVIFERELGDAWLLQAFSWTPRASRRRRSF
jgi:hypothetical protein